MLQLNHQITNMKLVMRLCEFSVRIKVGILPDHTSYSHFLPTWTLLSMYRLRLLVSFRQIALWV